MFYILSNGTQVINVDNDDDRNNLLAGGWFELTSEQISKAGITGYEQYVAPHNTVIDVNGDIIFTPPQPPTPEELAATVRAQRDALLAATDKYMTTDYPLSDEAKAAIKAYRQALRDIPQQEGFPENVVWPAKPETA